MVVSQCSQEVRDWVKRVAKPLDNRYTYVITSRMLLRQLILPPRPPAKLTPSPSHSCRLLCASKKVNSRQISNFQPLFAKHPGWGYLRIYAIWNQQHAASFSRTLQPADRYADFSARRRRRFATFLSPFVFTTIRIVFPATPFVSADHSRGLGFGSPKRACWSRIQ